MNLSGYRFNCITTKTVLFSVLSIILLNTTLNAQTRIRLDGPRYSDTNKIPLIIIDSFETNFNHLILNVNNIESINVFKDSSAFAKYGVKSKDGVIVINIKKEVEILRLKTLLEKYLPNQDYINIPIKINDKLIQYPQLILVDTSEILKLEMTNNEKSGNKIIQIITKRSQQIN